MSKYMGIVTEADLIKPIREAKPLAKFGRPPEAGLEELDMEDFLVEHELVEMYCNHPFVLELKLFKNKYLQKSLGRANYDEKRVEIDAEVLEKRAVAIQRAVFVRTICHFIAKKEYGTYEGVKYEMLVHKYLKKASTSKLLPLPKGGRKSGVNDNRASA